MNKPVLWLLAPLVFVLVVAVGCEELGGTAIMGTNNGNEDMMLIIDGVNYGVIKPGKSKTVSVSSGRHTVQFKYTDGVAASSIAYPTVSYGTTLGLSCDATR
ncbi:MAG: hypothetical protein JXN60_07685 [Lentisphaerae bacterium]|nr:hypothetical protein [Lentisphaerota bacterium]